MEQGLTLEDVARRAIEGDRDALDRLVKELQADVYGLALRMLWNREDAEDATQEILFKIITSVATFRGESSFRTWALRVATNHLLNVRRSRVEEESLTFEAFGRDLADGLADLLDPLAANADCVRDVRRIAHLDPGAALGRAHRTALEPQRAVSGISSRLPFPRRRPLLLSGEAGDDEARVGTLLAVLQPRDDTPLAIPGAATPS